MKIPDRLDIESLPSNDAAFAEAIIASAFNTATSLSELDGLPPLVELSDVSPSGARFIIPVILPEETETGDGRSFKKDSVTTRVLPLPLMWQIESGAGHNGSVIVGRIDSVERVEQGLGNAVGVFDVGVYGREAERLVRGGFLTKISADLDNFEATTEPDNEELADKNAIKNQKMVVDSARLIGATLVSKPAFQECGIEILEDPILALDEEIMPDGIYEETPEDYEYELSALAASAAPVVPPKSWFKNPELSGPTPLTTTDDGRVFGHIAAWDTAHIGMPGRNVRPPHSATQYAYFRTGELRTDEGDIQVGQLTLAGGHASMQASAEEAVKHYDDTNSAVADVTAGEDQFGIWVAGALRPEVTPQQVRQFRASSPSGDWRPINGRLELVAVCNVNVPGFPVARTIIAGGAPMALVAAGAAVLAEMKENSKLASLESRIADIENVSLSAKFSEVNNRMSSLVAARNEELSTRMAAAKERLQTRKDEQAISLSLKMEELKARFNS